MHPVSIESTLLLFFLYRTSLINAIMNFFLNQKFKNRTKESFQIIFFLKSVYTKLQRKKYFYSCSRNWNCESNLICVPKMAQRIAWLRKKIFRNLSSTLYLEKTKKKIKLPSKEAWIWAPKMFYGWNKKRHIFVILIYIPNINHRTLQEVNAWNNSVFSG